MRFRLCRRLSTSDELWVEEEQEEAAVVVVIVVKEEEEEKGVTTHFQDGLLLFATAC